MDEDLRGLEMKLVEDRYDLAARVAYGSALDRVGERDNAAKIFTEPLLFRYSSPSPEIRSRCIGAFNSLRGARTIKGYDLESHKPTIWLDDDQL